MFCSGCGQPLAPYQQTCAHCGKPAIPPPPAGYFPYSRVQRHVHTLAILWLVYSIFTILAWFVAIPFLGFIFAHHGMFHGGELPIPNVHGLDHPLRHGRPLHPVWPWAPGRHWALASRTLGASTCPGGRGSHAVETSLRYRAGNLHALGARTSAVRPGVRHGCRAVDQESDSQQLRLNLSGHFSLVRGSHHVDLAAHSKLRQINPRLDREASKRQ